jgi:hypothetical protein
MKKSWIIYHNMGPNEQQDFDYWLDYFKDQDDPLLDDVNPCECKERSDVLQLEDRKYCCDCCKIIKEAHHEPKEEKKEAEDTQ